MNTKAAKSAVKEDPQQSRECGYYANCNETPAGGKRWIGPHNEHEGDGCCRSREDDEVDEEKRALEEGGRVALKSDSNHEGVRTDGSKMKNET